MAKYTWHNIRLFLLCRTGCYPSKYSNFPLNICLGFDRFLFYIVSLIIKQKLIKLTKHEIAIFQCRPLMQFSKKKSYDTIEIQSIEHWKILVYLFLIWNEDLGFFIFTSVQVRAYQKECYIYESCCFTTENSIHGVTPFILRKSSNFESTDFKKLTYYCGARIPVLASDMQNVWFRQVWHFQYFW